MRVMFAPFAFGVLTLLALAGGGAWAWRYSDRQDPPLGPAAVLIGLALVGATATLIAGKEGGWNAGFGAAIWLSVIGSLLIYLLSILLSPQSRRLGCLLFAYLFLLAVAASVWPGAAATGEGSDVSAGGWFLVHIVPAIATYALATLAAIASVAVLVQETALKRRARPALSQRLPSIADGEQLEARYLLAAEIVLGVGIVTGMALNLTATGSLLTFDHKTVLTLLAFLLIALLLLLQSRSGLRGKRLGRLVLLCYLLLTLAYPGVKFVTDVLLTSPA